MTVEYDKYYQTENLFGEPYPELTKLFSNQKKKGKLLDLGCGQGRDSIMLAKLGFQVTGIDYSEVGIAQLNKIAKNQKLPLEGIVGDIYEYTNFSEFDFVLLDSMFHFSKKDKKKEIALLERIFNKVKPEAHIVICIQKVGKKIEILNLIISEYSNIEIVYREELLYEFKDEASNHSSKTTYELITLIKKE